MGGAFDDGGSEIDGGDVVDGPASFVREDFWDAAGLGADDRPSCSEGLCDDIGDAVLVTVFCYNAWNTQTGHGLEEGWELGLGEAPLPDDGICDIEFFVI